MRWPGAGGLPGARPSLASGQGRGSGRQALGVSPTVQLDPPGFNSRPTSPYIIARHTSVANKGIGPSVRSGSYFVSP